jgi:signal transduction histidine kinase
MRSILLVSIFYLIFQVNIPEQGLHAQPEYFITNYTSKQGLPQNSIRGLAFDGHGFLWLATEGGIARFDGQRFKTISPVDHLDLRKQRYTNALQCQDGDIVFMDMLMGMYRLSGDCFFTLQQPEPDNQKFISYIGSPPHAQFLASDSFFLEEFNRIPDDPLTSIVFYPVSSSKVFMASDRIVFVDLSRKERKVIEPVRNIKDKYARLDDIIIRLSASGELWRWKENEPAFKKCMIKDEEGQLWKGNLASFMVNSKYPFDLLLVHDREKMYRIDQGENDSTLIIRPFISHLPADCNVITIAYHQPSGTIVLGTDLRGIFIYRKKAFNTFVQHAHQFSRKNSLYAQTLLDSNTLLVGNGLLVDINALQVKGLFPKSLNDIHLAADENQNIFYYRHNITYRYHIPTQTEHIIHSNLPTSVQALQLINGEIWIGTSTGVGRIMEDSIHWEFEMPYVSEHHGIKSINIDPGGHLWFGTYFNLYRLNRETKQLDSFPELTNTDVRVIEIIRGRLFIGTYGAGYFIYDHGRMVRMPDGRNHELTNTHAFIEDKEGYLWIPTNRGLYKTHLDAIEDYLADPTKHLDYYCYLEEDGIINAEFNGGCSPTHLWLPDGRLSLPSLEGLVIFNPSATSHFFSADSIVIEYVEVDGLRYKPDQLTTIPASHANITVHFAGAWWNNLYNQYVYWTLDDAGAPHSLFAPDQTTLSIGHLSPGKHKLLLHRRDGFGNDDFVLSRLAITVEKPWYAKGWAIIFFALGVILLTWSIAALNSRSIRKRNIELQKKVDEQTKELIASNSQLEENVNKLATSEINLRRNIRVRDRLISIITHDILTPLRFISQISRLGAEEKPADHGLAKRALADVQNASHKLFHSTQNLLHWVTYHQENFSTVSVNCSPFAIVEQLMEDFSEMAHFQGNTLINEVPEDDVILTDPRILTIILHNLLSNAIKYTQNGIIRVNSGIEQNWFVLEVIDNGRGMTPEQIEAVRTGTLRQGEISDDAITAGNGIGLSLVADLVEALNGRWDIESPEGKGVRVRLFISLEQIHDH